MLDQIDLPRCVYCADACPEEPIFMSRENDLVGTTRAELVIDRDRLMERGRSHRFPAFGPGTGPR